MSNIEHFKHLVKKSETIVITTHLYPDADGIGSEIALALALKLKGKRVYCVNEDPLLERYRYLDSSDVVISYKDFEVLNVKHIDLLIVVDTNALPRVGHDLEDLAKGAKELLFIDHHPAPKELAAIHCIDTKKAATGELVGELISALHLPYTKEMALALYTAIVIDTSSFRYPTVSARTHHLIGTLMETGIDPSIAYNLIYGTKKITHMHLLGNILSRSQSTDDGTVSWLTLSEDLLDKHHVDPEDTHAFINHLLVLDNIKVACMFREQGKFVKISLRSTGDIDVGILAQALGGGGHNHSAATVIEGTLHDVTKETVEKIRKMLSNGSGNEKHPHR